MLWILIRSALLMSTQNVCFQGERRKIFSRLPFLPGAMDFVQLYIAIILKKTVNTKMFRVVWFFFN